MNSSVKIKKRQATRHVSALKHRFDVPDEKQYDRRGAFEVLGFASVLPDGYPPTHVVLRSPIRRDSRLTSTDAYLRALQAFKENDFEQFRVPWAPGGPGELGAEGVQKMILPSADTMEGQLAREAVTRCAGTRARIFQTLYRASDGHGAYRLCLYAEPCLDEVEDRQLSSSARA